MQVGKHLHCASTSHLIEMVANIKDRTMTHLSSTIKHIYDVTTDWKELLRVKVSRLLHGVLSALSEQLSGIKL